MVTDARFRRTIVIGLVGGVVHACLALWLSAIVRGQSVSGMYAPETPTGVAILAVTVLGLVALGGLPLVLALRNGLVGPLVALVLLFAWAFYSSWHAFEGARTTDATSISLASDSLFGLLWIVPLAIVLLVAALEYGLRRHVDGLPPA